MAFSGAYLCRGGRATWRAGGAGRINPTLCPAWQAQDAFQYTRADWAAVVDATFEGLVTQLPSQTFFGELYSHFAKAECWHVYEDVIPTLTALRQQGIRLAVISNWDDRLRPLLKSLELAHWFEVIHVSAEIGAHKPDARIFQTAAESLGIRPLAFFMWGMGNVKITKEPWSAGFNPAGFAAAQRIPWPYHSFSRISSAPIRDIKAHYIVCHNNPYYQYIHNSFSINPRFICVL